MKRPGLAVLLGLVAASACSRAAAPHPAPACHVVQFRACKDPCGRGVQYCLASGAWSPCTCVVGDASLAGDGASPDADGAAGDAGDGAPPDADGAAGDAGLDTAPPDAGDATDAEDADAASDSGLLD